jgi:hypothetical protein
LTTLCEALRNVISWHTDTEFKTVKQKWKCQLSPFLKNIVAIVDGSEITISRSSDLIRERASYSMKKKQHSMTLLLICQPDEKIIYASDPLLDSSEQRHWSELNLRDLFENKKYEIISDSRVTFNHKDGEETQNETLIPGRTLHKKTKKQKLNQNTKETK